ncbi:PTS system nitrogen regulatory IIA component [Litorivivens lipolytica]|uniref:PTS system nitrogen regulatory IIA component n=1 Tax=Litorivivens lipolytica TaxID=1524264 RepID=A0A7W4W4E0_9GAMM|nr:PTS sugar transporter subunit IIA [Litorivivens lipolytica]MBB3047115.1 PTS system nitrogen regulatory IIA component [Litorivivens lipolytica]
MLLEHFLTRERTYCGAASTSKKRLLEDLSQFISEDVPALNAQEIYTHLLNRERLGSTGIGFGVAIPHCRVSNCSSIVGALITLNEPVNFESVDDQPVDILFALVAPEEGHDEHLKALSSIAERLNNPEFRERLRSASDADQLFRNAIDYIP